MMVLMLMGGGAITSIVPVYLRCRIFEENAKKSYEVPKNEKYMKLCNHLADVCVEVSSK